MPEGSVESECLREWLWTVTMNRMIKDGARKMRLRNIKGSRERIAADEAVVQEAASNKGAWSTFFGNNNPLYIAIGM